MSGPKSVVVERDLAHPPAKVWRALTTSELISDWLMPTSFTAEVGHRFSMGGDWGSVDCEVLDVEPERRLTYRWDGAGLESTVTFTLTPSDRGTHLRMEQAGFRADQGRAWGGARQGWPRFLDRLETVLDRIG